MQQKAECLAVNIYLLKNWKAALEFAEAEESWQVRIQQTGTKQVKHVTLHEDSLDK